MGKGVNKAIIIGNLGADPDVRYTSNGNPVANLSIATDESYKDRNTGQKVEKTEWHRVVMFSKIAEVAGQYLSKGSKVYIEGKLQTRKWQDQSGIDRYSTEILVDINGQMQMLDGANNSGNGLTGQGQQRANQGRNEGDVAAKSEGAGPYGAAPIDDFDDDIPF